MRCASRVAITAQCKKPPFVRPMQQFLVRQQTWLGHGVNFLRGRCARDVKRHSPMLGEAELEPLLSGALIGAGSNVARISNRLFIILKLHKK